MLGAPTHSPTLPTTVMALSAAPPPPSSSDSFRAGAAEVGAVLGELSDYSFRSINAAPHGRGKVGATAPADCTEKACPPPFQLSAPR